MILLYFSGVVSGALAMFLLGPLWENYLTRLSSCGQGWRFWHEWQNWKDTEDGKYSKKQIRRCTRCNKAETGTYL